MVVSHCEYTLHITQATLDASMPINQQSEHTTAHRRPFHLNRQQPSHWCSHTHKLIQRHSGTGTRMLWSRLLQGNEEADRQ